MAKREIRKPAPVDWQALEKEITAYFAMFDTAAVAEKMFRNIVDDDDGCDPMPIIHLRLPVIEQAILDGRTQDAIGETACLVVDLCARIETMAAAVRAAKPRIAASVKTTEGSKNGTAALQRTTAASDRKIHCWIAAKMRTGDKVSLSERRRQAAIKFKISEGTVLRAQQRELERLLALCRAEK